MKRMHQEPHKLPRRDWSITHDCLDLIIECAKSNYPNEFGGLLRRDSEKKDLITELVLLPGTVSGDTHAIFKLHMLPIDFSIVGTVHSHPSPNAQPSSADRQLFEKFGRINIIIALPYTTSSWKAFDFKGEEIKLTVV